jgi:hypothetical protein
MRRRLFQTLSFLLFSKPTILLFFYLDLLRFPLSFSLSLCYTGLTSCLVEARQRKLWTRWRRLLSIIWSWWLSRGCLADAR